MFIKEDILGLKYVKGDNLLTLYRLYLDVVIFFVSTHLHRICKGDTIRYL